MGTSVSPWWQGGSIAWRTVQNPTGHDFGHHMSKAAANMGGRAEPHTACPTLKP